MTSTPSVTDLPLSQVDPEIAAVLDAGTRPPARHPGNDRLRELRAARRAGGPGLRPDQQVRRGLPGPPLLRRLRVRRRRREAGDRPRQGRCSAPSTPTSSRTPVRRPTPPRSSAMITPGDKILGLSLAHGGHLTHGMKLNFSGKLYQVAAYQVEEDTFRVDMDKLREQALAEKPAGHHRRLVRLPAPPGLRGLPFHRRRGRRAALDRHGALRRPGRRRAAPEPGAALRRRHLHRAQDPRRSALRRDPGQAGVGQEDQLQRLPGPAGRPAHARHRRQGRGLQDRRHARNSRSARSACWKAPGSSPSA